MVKIPTTVESYRKKRSEYEDLAEHVEDILFEILTLEKINFAFTESRAKKIDSFQSKIKKLDGIHKELFDLAGIRIVGYVRYDVENIVKTVRENFDVDESKSKDKATELKPNQFGYRAIHLVCTMPSTRTILPEYEKFKGMYFEIQIKTILEHGWAQIEHDRNYKYKGLPDDIQHDFYLVAGILESADNQFESITKRIESFDQSVKQKTDEGKLEELELNPATLKRYLVNRFENKMPFEPLYGSDEDPEDGKIPGEGEVQELLDVGLKNLKELDSVFPENFIEIETEYRKIADRGTGNLSSIIFALLYLVYEDKAEQVLSKSRGLTTKQYEDFLSDFKKAKNYHNEN